MILFDVIFGFLLLCAGRNLFWVCVGIIGFLLGVQFAATLGYANQWMGLLLAIALGCIGMVLSIAFEWFMIVFGVGFLGGGYLLMSMASPLVGQESYTWLIFIVGGIVGMCLMIILFDWTLIVISSLLGATLIVEAFPQVVNLRNFLFLGCFLAGILIQYVTLTGLGRQQKASE